MLEWLVELEGDRAELEYLPRMSFKTWRPTEQCGKYYLKSAEFDSSADARDVREDASRTLNVMNGLAKVMFGNFRGARVRGITRVDETGKQTQFIMPSGVPSAEKVGIPTVVTSSEQEPPQPPASPGAKWLEIAEKDESVARALELYGRLEPNWIDLYKVLEVVEEDVTGEESLMAKNWVEKSKIKRFKHTANWMRHPPTKYKSPKTPMSLDDARSLIRNILEAWLGSKQH